MGCVPGPMFCGLAMLALSGCTTDSCDCPPGIVPGLVTGHVIRAGGTPVAGAPVHAFSGAAAGCESLDTDFGIAVTGADGGFRLESGFGHPAGGCLRAGLRSPSGRGGSRSFRHGYVGDGLQGRAHAGQCSGRAGAGRRVVGPRVSDRLVEVET